MSSKQRSVEWSGVCNIDITTHYTYYWYYWYYTSHPSHSPATVSNLGFSSTPYLPSLVKLWIIFIFFWNIFNLSALTWQTQDFSGKFLADMRGHDSAVGQSEWVGQDMITREDSQTCYTPLRSLTEPPSACISPDDYIEQNMLSVRMQALLSTLKESFNGN